VARNHHRSRATQAIRAFDVIILGPAMILAGRQIENPTLRAIVTVSGATTILYNAGNYASVERERRRKIRSA
jgi:hypothetical protein